VRGRERRKRLVAMVRHSKERRRGGKKPAGAKLPSSDRGCKVRMKEFTTNLNLDVRSSTKQKISFDFLPSYALRDQRL